METETLFLPPDIVQSSPGFSCDFGSSLIKVIYRSKDDFTDGKPVNKDAVRKGTGRVHLARIPRMSGMKQMIDLVSKKCDLKRPTDGVLVVPVTGIGANLSKQEIESKLNIRLQIRIEDGCILAGFQAMFDYLPMEQLEYPIPGEDLEAAKIITKFGIGWHASSGNVAQDVYSKLTVHELPPGDKPYLPCLIVNTGSNHFIMLMNEKGELITIDGIFMGAKALTNFAIHCLGKKDFDELIGELETADGITSNIFYKELVSGGTGNYSLSNQDIRHFYMGKLDLINPDHVKKADVAQSMFRMGVGFLAQMAFTQASAYGVRKIYFTGSFINVPFLRKIITMELQGRVDLRPKHQQVEHHFMRYGSYCGALGVFVQQTNQQ